MALKALVHVLSRMAIGLALAATAGPAHAMDWLAERLRGDVYRVEDDQWVPVLRGDVVPAGTIVWTTRNGYADFRSGENTVSLSPGTQVKFIARPAQGQNWVQLWFGDVDVEVEARNVPHFAVQTPYMVAVVRGTAFSVSSDDEGAEVDVHRGVVAVRETRSDSNVTLTAGQRASGGLGGVLFVSGSGALPVIMDAQGNPISSAAPSPAASAGNAGATPAAANANNGNGNATPGNRPGNSGNTPAAANANNGNATPGNRPGNSGNTPAAANANNGNSNAGGNGNGNGNARSNG